MQDFMEFKRANDNYANLSVANFNKSEFSALSRENQVLFLASALVEIGNEISELIKGQDQLIAEFSELRADQKSLQDEISLLDAKLDGFNDNLENQDSKIKDQNQRKSNAKSRIKFWVIG